MEENEKTPPVYASDRRAAHRIPTKIALRFNDPKDAARALRAYSVNVSTGGIAVRTNFEYPIGASLQITLEIGPDELTLSSVIAWSREGIVGARFVNMKPDDAKRLQRLISTLPR